MFFHLLETVVDNGEIDGIRQLQYPVEWMLCNEEWGKAGKWYWRVLPHHILYCIYSIRSVENMKHPKG